MSTYVEKVLGAILQAGVNLATTDEAAAVAAVEAAGLKGEEALAVVLTSAADKALGHGLGAIIKPEVDAMIANLDAQAKAAIQTQTPKLIAEAIAIAQAEATKLES